RELFPSRVPPALVSREVCHHGTKCGSQRSDERGHRAAARGRALACGEVGEAFDRQQGQETVSLSVEPVLEDPLHWIERTKLIEPHAADRDFQQFALRHSYRALLFSQEIASRFEQGGEWNQSYHLGAGHPHAALLGLSAHLLERHVQW